MSALTDWIVDGSDNRVLRVVEFPARAVAALIWVNAIIFGAFFAFMAIWLLAVAIGHTSPG